MFIQSIIYYSIIEVSCVLLCKIFSFEKVCTSFAKLLNIFNSQHLL